MLVDSKKKMIDPPEIILEAVRHIKSNKYTPDQVFASVMTEAQESAAILMRQGNTLFIVHDGKDRTALFRALNADTAKNYLENSVMFAKAMYMAGYDVMVTDFQDSTLLSIFKYVQQHRDEVNPDVDGKPTMGYAVQKIKNMKEGGNGYRVTTVLGPKREGQIK